MTSEQIAELRRLERAATKGPWEAQHDGPDGTWISATSQADGWNRVAEFDTGEIRAFQMLVANVDLVAALRTHARALLDAADENVVLRAEVVAWREWHDYDGESVETNHFNYQDRIDARAATDAAGALGKDGE